MTHSHIPVQHLIKQVELNRSKRNNRDVRPQWVTCFIEQVAELFEPAADVARVGFDCRLDEDGWNVGLYLGRTELIGGKADGESRHTNFEFDLRALCDRFERIDRFTWTSLPDAVPETANAPGFITVNGLVANNPIRVRLYAIAPPDAGPGFRQFPSGKCDPA